MERNRRTKELDHIANKPLHAVPLFKEKENNVKVEKSIGKYLFVFFFDDYYRTEVGKLKIFKSQVKSSQ
jgi:hypothetical protein